MACSHRRWSYQRTSQNKPLPHQVGTPLVLLLSDHTLSLVDLDEGVVMQLVSMGFNLEGCKKAVYHTHNHGVEPAMNWVLEHMGDAGIHVE